MSSEYMTLREAAATYRIGGLPLTAHQLYCWCHTGKRGHRLVHVQGKPILVTHQAITEFLSSLEVGGDTPQKKTVVTFDQRISDTQQRLAERGL